MQTALQYQLLLDQHKNKKLVEELQEQTDKKAGLKSELTKLLNESKVDLQQETPSFDGFLWKRMLGLLQTRLTGDCAPFLRTLTVLYNGITGQDRPPPPCDVTSPRPDAGYVGCERLARGRGFARRHLLIGFFFFTVDSYLLTSCF